MYVTHTHNAFLDSSQADRDSEAKPSSPSKEEMEEYKQLIEDAGSMAGIVDPEIAAPEDLYVRTSLRSMSLCRKAS